MEHTSEVFTNLKLWPVKNSKSVLANGQVTVAGVVRVKFTVLNGKNGPWIKMPAQQTDKKNEQGYPVEYPFISFEDKDVKQTLQDLVKVEYSSLQNSSHGSSDAGESSQVVPSVQPGVATRQPSGNTSGRIPF